MEQLRTGCKYSVTRKLGKARDLISLWESGIDGAIAEASRIQRDKERICTSRKPNLSVLKKYHQAALNNFYSLIDHMMIFREATTRTSDCKKFMDGWSPKSKRR